MSTPHITIDTRRSMAIIATLLWQILWFARFISKMDSRIWVLEEDRKTAKWYTYSDWKLLEQQIQFYTKSTTESISDIKFDIKDIKNSLK